MSEYIIRPYRDGDEQYINSAFNQVFNLKRSLEEWRWKFNVDNTDPAIIVALDKSGKVMAHYAATQVDISINGHVYRCGQPVDVYSTKQKGSVQGRLYIKTVREFFKTFGGRDKLQLLFGFPSARVLKLGQLKLDYGEPVPVIEGKRIVKNRRLIFKKKPQSDNVDLESIDRLWEKSSHRYPVSTVRNAEYIKTRYLSRPENKYIYISVNDGSDTRVFSVLEYNENAIKWIDLIWDGQDSTHLMEMDRLVEKLTRLAGVPSNQIWISNDSDAIRTLKQKGWEFVPHGDLFLVAMSFHSEINSNEFINKLYFTLGDSDLV